MSTNLICTLSPTCCAGYPLAVQGAPTRQRRGSRRQQRQQQQWRRRDQRQRQRRQQQEGAVPCRQRHAAQAVRLQVIIFVLRSLLPVAAASLPTKMRQHPIVLWGHLACSHLQGGDHRVGPTVQCERRMDETDGGGPASRWVKGLQGGIFSMPIRGISCPLFTGKLKPRGGGHTQCRGAWAAVLPRASRPRRPPGADLRGPGKHRAGHAAGAAPPRRRGRRFAALCASPHARVCMPLVARRPSVDLLACMAPARADRGSQASQAWLDAPATQSPPRPRCVGVFPPALQGTPCTQKLEDSSMPWRQAAPATGPTRGCGTATLMTCSLLDPFDVCNLSNLAHISVRERR